MSKITEAELLAKIEALGDISEEQRNEITCSLIGHSRIVTACFGYVHCARCGAQLADRLGGAGFNGAPDAVFVGHNCPQCRENFEKMGWEDRIFTPDPFAKVRACRVCGCTDDNACPGGCYWVEEDLCNVCAEVLAALEDVAQKED